METHSREGYVHAVFNRSGYREVVVDVSAFRRDDVCLRCAEVDNQFFFNAGIDDVAIDLC